MLTDRIIIDRLRTAHGTYDKIGAALAPYRPDAPRPSMQTIVNWRTRGIADGWRYGVLQLVLMLPDDQREGFHEQSFMQGVAA